VGRSALPLGVAFSYPIKMPAEDLPPGCHPYEAIASACRRGDYAFASVRAASGRLNFLIGLSPERLERLSAEARRHAVGFLLVGSRVSGPRLRQRTLHPALAAGLPLKTRRRSASALYPGTEGVEIDKTAIKELGREDPRSSDLSVVLIDARRGPEALDALARELEAALSSWGWPFPVRVFSELLGRRHGSEEDFLATGEGYLQSLLPEGHAFSSEELREAVQELYLAVNLPRPWLGLRDLRNGLATAALFSASFSLGLGFHPVLPAVGFVFGALGRYLARLRAGVAFRWGDGWLANAAALLLDAALGAAVMAFVINPAAGLGLRLGAIVLASLSHTASKGSLRLFLDKRFSGRREREQAAGVLATSVLNFLQGVVTSFVYAGSSAAMGVQAALCGLGLFLVFSPAWRRLKAG